MFLSSSQCEKECYLDITMRLSLVPDLNMVLENNNTILKCSFVLLDPTLKLKGYFCKLV